jgi:thiamine biosynthesis lipoprotein
MNRRDFLHPRHLLQTAGELAGAVAELNTADATPEEFSVLRSSSRAMACKFELLLPYGRPHAFALAATMFDEVDRLEQQLTVYRDSSEVSQLNHLAAHAPVAAEEQLFQLLSLAAQISRETDGAHDIATGALIKAWGFFRGPRRVPSEPELTEARANSGMQHLVLDPAHRSVRYLRPRLEINLGSIGKGYALDCAAELLRQDTHCSCALLHGGQSSVYAMGSEPGSSQGWCVGIKHPWETERRLAMVRLRDRALGTSAATFQHLEYNGRRLGHILDPRTGWPAEGMASVTVLAPTAALADALATAFFVLGVEKSRQYCEGHPEIGALLLPAGHDAAPVVIGLSSEDLSDLTP